MKTDDTVRSIGRIQTIQDGRVRYLTIARGTVVDVDSTGVTVNPVGMKAQVICQPDDLVPMDAPERPEPEPKPDAEPTGGIAVSGTAEEEQPKSIKAVRAKKTGDKTAAPKPKPRRRRDR